MPETWRRESGTTETSIVERAKAVTMLHDPLSIKVERERT
jgi:hypothetical protein